MLHAEAMSTVLSEQVPRQDVPTTARAFMGENYALYGDRTERALETYHLVVAPSFACNLQCAHCYLPNHDSDRIPTERLLRLVAEWAEICIEDTGERRGVFHLKGGEPLLLSDLDQVVSAVQTTKALSLMITTNGTVLNGNVVDSLARFNDSTLGQLRVQVSLDGATAETNALLRGPASFERALQFVRLMHCAGITTYLNIVVHADNFSELASCLSLAASEGVAQVNFLTFVPSGFGADIIERTPSLVAVYKRLTELYQAGGPTVRRLMYGSYPHMVAMHNSGERAMSLGDCIGGYRGMTYITPAGDVFSCPNLVCKSLSFGNIQQQALREIIAAFPQSTCERLTGAIGDAEYGLTCAGEQLLQLPSEWGTTRRAMVAELGEAVRRDLVDDTRAIRGCTTHCFSRNL